MEKMNSFCALNIDVIKTKFGQKHSTASIDIYILLIQLLLELLYHDES